jgi:hypothetical protein
MIYLLDILNLFLIKKNHMGEIMKKGASCAKV